MFHYAKYLIVSLLLFATSDVNADIAWPALYVVAGKSSIWVIIGGLLVETGFVKYFARKNWWKTILVSVVMNLATGIIGNIIIAIGGLGVAMLMAFVPTFHIVVWIATYFFAVIINTIIESIIIQLMLKLNFKKTYKWVFVANAISIIMCAIYVAVVDVRL